MVGMMMMMVTVPVMVMFADSDDDDDGYAANIMKVKKVMLRVRVVVILNCLISVSFPAVVEMYVQFVLFYFTISIIPGVWYERQ